MAALLQFQTHVHRFAIAQQAQVHFAADRHRADFSTQRREPADWLAVQGGDHITRLDTGFRRRRIWHHLADKGPALRVNFHCLRQFGVQFRAQNTQFTAFDLAEFNHLAGQVFHHITWNRKTDTDVAAVRCQNRGVDTDQLTVQVNQRTAGVTAVNGRIRLDKVFVVFRIQAATAQCRNDTGCHRFTQTKRVTDGDGVIADAQGIGISQLNGRQVFWILNLNQSDVRARVFTHHFGIKFTPIAQLYFDGAGVIYNVVIGDDIAFRRVNNHARSQRHEFLLLTATVTARAVIARTTALTER
ncbi:hypothetical protein D3C80_939370 [compost metagenome]